MPATLFLFDWESEPDSGPGGCDVLQERFGRYERVDIGWVVKTSTHAHGLKKWQPHVTQRFHQKKKKKMLTGKSIIEAATSEPDGYFLLTLQQPTKQVEIEKDNMTLFVKFSLNKKSLWNVMVRQANDNFTLRDARNVHHDGEVAEERIYATPADKDFGVILTNDAGEIRVQTTTPVSERAINKFIEWAPETAGCCRVLVEVLKLSLGEQSQSEHYVPGALLGEPSY
jgi:hypothetical protein